MTDERKNEIWAMLDAEAQEWIKEQYQEILEDIADYKAQNTDNGSPIMENRAIGQKQMLIRLFGKHNLTAQANENQETKGNNKKKSENFPIDYSQYRLDIAKEIAVEMSSDPNTAFCIPKFAVDMANEIIKRLKETE